MDIVSIILKHLREETTEEENKVLMDWIGESEAHKKEFSDLKAIWNAGTIYDGCRGAASIPAAMREIDKKIRAAQRRSRRRIMAFVAAGLSAAACVAAALVLFVHAGVFSGPGASHYLTFDNTTDSVMPLTLEDGTSVWLKAGSTITVPKPFHEDRRDVTLKGEAYFDVVHDSSAPFRVKTEKLTVKVLGTAFCVKARPQDNNVEVILERGSVRLQDKNGHNLATLSPDQKAEYNAEQEDLKISSVNAVGMLLLEYDLVTMSNASLYQIITRVEDEYKVRLSGPVSALDRKYTFNYLRSNSIEDVLKIIEYLTGNRYEVVYKDAE